MQRRQILAGAGAALGASALGTPALGQGTQGATRLLRYIPETDLAILDPIITTAYVTRNHAYMVWDTLYGLDADYKAQPQMVDSDKRAKTAEAEVGHLRSLLARIAPAPAPAMQTGAIQRAPDALATSSTPSTGRPLAASRTVSM